MAMDAATRAFWGWPELPRIPAQVDEINGIPVVRTPARPAPRQQEQKPTTDYVHHNGWHVYVVVRQNQAVVVVRDQPSSPYVQGSAGRDHIVRTFTARSQVAAWAKYLAWANTNAADASSNQDSAGGGGSGPRPGPAPGPTNWDPWSAEDAGTDFRVERELRVIEARNLLGAHLVRTRSQLRTQFAELALQHHPDHGGDSEKWMRIQAAYSYLRQMLRDELPGRTTADQEESEDD